ncbi:hypothetical protein [Dichelobacter nodosus]|uniref:hypothetical protein n=1 Tax=Dichelobacter nodosus TaxID=870 RepID=UPI000681E7B8|nr:hypothetical protein [Dichelobacter nodosus]KNZ39965.1 hypothetical protein AKG33_01060 [Dichelobacter nodosus]
MSEPIITTGSVAISTIVYKLLLYLVGPLLASIIVMLMTPPKNPREWTAIFISTIVCSVGLGAYFVTNLLNISIPFNELDAMVIGGVYFACGLPGWFLVRSAFRFMEVRKNQDIVEIITEIKRKSDE